MTVPSLTPELTAYLTQMQTLFAGLDALPETSDPMAVTDISKVTDADIKAYETALDQMKTALNGLKDLKPPAEIAAFQDALVKGIESSIDIAGKAIDALKDKDQAAFDAAKADADALDAEMETDPRAARSADDGRNGDLIAIRREARRVRQRAASGRPFSSGRGIVDGNTERERAIDMIDPRIQDAINDQLNYELYSAYIYYSMESWFRHKGFNGFANWMAVQVKEEMGHAQIMFNFVTGRTAGCSSKASKAPTTNGSPRSISSRRRTSTNRS